MTNVSKLWALFLFFVLGGVTPGGIFSHSYEIPLPMFVVNLEPVVTPEQKAVASHLAAKYSQSESLLVRIVKAAYIEGSRVGVSPLTLLAIMEKESGFRASVVNAYGAVGLMQVVPRYHREKLGKGDEIAQLQEPATNIRVGTTILAEYLRSNKGDLSKALKKYSGSARQYAERVAFYKGQLERVRDSSRKARTAPTADDPDGLLVT
jgi:soluble lytic murein transglycosylase-like protein